MQTKYFLLTPILFLACAAALDAQTLAVDQQSMSFNAQVGGQAVTQTLNVTSSSGSILAFVQSNTPAWLKVNGSNAASGNTPLAVTVTADPAGLTAGPYSSTISVYGGGPTLTVQVSMTVGSIGVSPQSLQFAYTIAGVVPTGQSLTLTGQPTSFTVAATSGENWLQVDRASGASPGSITALLNSATVPGLAAGAHTGSIVITPTSGSATTPITVPVTLTVTPTPPVTATPAQISLAYQIGGTTNPGAQQILSLATTGNQVLSFSIQPSDTWLLVNPAAGTIPANNSNQIAVGYDTSKNLAAGTYTGKLSVFTPGASPSSQEIPVTLLVSQSPLLSVPAGGLKFTYELGAALPPAQSLTAASTGGPIALNLQPSTANGVSWLTVAPASGSTGAPFSVSVVPGTLSLGTYTGNIAITGTGAGNSPLNVPVTLTVTNNPVLQVGATALSFPFQIGQTAPAAQNVGVTSSTGAVLNYTATAAATSCGNGWLSLGGTTTGSTSGIFSVAVNPTGLPAGTCQGTISVAGTDPSTGAATPGSPATIAVTLVVSANPLLVVTPPAALNFLAPVSGQAPAPLSVTLTSSDSSKVLNYSVTSTTDKGGNWLLVGPTSGTTASGANTVSVSVSAPATPGTYTGSITITATNPAGTAVDNSPVTIPVILQVSAGTLVRAPASLNFVQAVGGSAPASQTITLTASGQALTYSATAANQGSVAWLSVTQSSASGTTPATITVNADGSKLAAGSYAGTITILAFGPNGAPVAGSPAVVNVTLVVAPTVTATPASLTFTQIQGAAAPAAQSLSIAATPGPVGFTVTYTTKDGANWLTVTPASGNTPATLQVSVDGAKLAPGTYNGTITITAAGNAIGSPLSVAVTFTVPASQPLTATPATLNFTYVLGATAPPTQTVQISSSGTNTSFTATAKTSDNGSWLSVTPASGNTPGTLTVAVNPQSLTANTYTGTITISSPNSATPAVVAVNLSIVAIPTPVVIAVKNAASWAVGAISPGENIVIGGTGLGPAVLAGAQLGSDGRLATTVSDTQVLFDGRPAPIIYAWAPQTSVMVPYEVGSQATTTVRIVYKGVQSDPIVYNVTAAAPGIYTLNQAGSGPPVILNHDGATPVAKGSGIAFYMTGEGATNLPSTTGGIAPSDGSGLNKPVLPVTATVAGLPARVDYYGSAPGAIYGVMQVNITIPDNTPSGPQALVVTLGTSTSTQSNVIVNVQ